MVVRERITNSTIGALLLSSVMALALDRVEVRPNGVSLSGYMSGAVVFQFGGHAGESAQQKTEQLERQRRIVEFARDSFRQLNWRISYFGTNVPMSKCLADLANQVGAPIPMDLGNRDFTAKEFTFEQTPLMDVLKYLVAFDDAVLDTSNGRLVRKSVRFALLLGETEHEVLRLMARQKFTAAGRVLAKEPVNVRIIKDQDGRNLLHLAAWKNQTSIAARLVALGVDINAKDNVGYTPLHEAVRFGHWECAELLLKSGADSSLADNNNDAPLKTAIYFGHLRAAKSLVEHGAPVDLFTASGLGMVEEVKKKLNSGVDYRAEQQAYVGKHRESGRLYFTSMSDPVRNMPGSCLGIHGVTPLHWAARGGNVEMAALWVSRGESVSAKDSSGETPLFWAAVQGRLETARFLIEQGADVNATNVCASTPLLTAARSTVSPQLVSHFIKAGAKVNVRDDSAENALHKLAWFGYPKENVQTARMLLDAGVDITAKNKDGQTPLDVLLANSLRNSDLLQLYRDHCAKASSSRKD